MKAINEYLTTGKTTGRTNGKTWDYDVTTYVISCVSPGFTEANKVYTCRDDNELKKYLQKHFKYSPWDKVDWEKNIYDNVIKLKKGQAFVYDLSYVNGEPGYDVYTRIND